MIKSINPANGQTLAEFAPNDDVKINAVFETADAAQKKWALIPMSERMPYLSKVAHVLRRDKEALGQLITLEMGKPLAEAIGEVEKCAWNFDFYAESALGYLSDLVLPSSATDSRLVYDPLGIVLAVMPWNYPFWQVMRAAAPVLASGNGLVLKHASNVPQCALALESVFKEAGLPLGLFSVLLVGADKVPQLVNDARVRAVTSTGSTPVGRQIASASAFALKKQVLELGGSDPFIVLADADVQAAAKVAVKARFQNTGQSCIAAKRFIVEASIADDFVSAFCEFTRALKIGDPMLGTSTQGSMARVNLRDELHAQVQASITEGAKLLMGGRPVQGPGAFYEPTVFDHVLPSMTIAREETFGPAAAILRVGDVQEALKIANDSPFGLGAAIWTQDIDRAHQLAHHIQAGAVFINGMVASDPRLPFGGIKESGYGRELGMLGMHEFTNIKTVWRGPAII